MEDGREIFDDDLGEPVGGTAAGTVRFIINPLIDNFHS